MPLKPTHPFSWDPVSATVLGLFLLSSFIGLCWISWVRNSEGAYHHSCPCDSSVIRRKKLSLLGSQHSREIWSFCQMSNFITCLYRTFLEVNYLFHAESARKYFFQKYSISPPRIEWWPPYAKRIYRLWPYLSFPQPWLQTSALHLPSQDLKKHQFERFVFCLMCVRTLIVSALMMPRVEEWKHRSHPLEYLPATSDYLYRYILWVIHLSGVKLRSKILNVLFTLNDMEEVSCHWH